MAKSELEQRFMWSVQALAQPADVQRTLFPSFVCIGDELALGFDDAWRNWRARDPVLAESQRAAIEELNRYLDELSGEHNAEFWLNADRLGQDRRWDSIRKKAGAVLDALGWPHDQPPRDGAIFVNADGAVRND